MELSLKTVARTKHNQQASGQAEHLNVYMITKPRHDVL